MPEYQRHGIRLLPPHSDFTFLEKELTDRKDEFDKTVVSMHVRPYADQFNNNVARVFHRYVTEFSRHTILYRGPRAPRFRGKPL